MFDNVIDLSPDFLNNFNVHYLYNLKFTIIVGIVRSIGPIKNKCCYLKVSSSKSDVLYINMSTVKKKKKKN